MSRLDRKASPKLAASFGFCGNTGPKLPGFPDRAAAPGSVSPRPRGEQVAGWEPERSRESRPQIYRGRAAGQAHLTDRHRLAGGIRSRSATASSPHRAQRGDKASQKGCERVLQPLPSPLSVLPPQTLPEAAQVDFATHTLGEPISGRRKATAMWNRAAGGGFRIGWGSWFSRSEKGRRLCLH